jgi:hypothetical protein
MKKFEEERTESDVYLHIKFRFYIQKIEDVGQGGVSWWQK